MKEKIKKVATLVGAILTVLMIILTFLMSKELDRLRGSLTAKDAEIQQLDIELGISKSTLTDVTELNEKYKSEIDEFPKRLKKIINEYELQINSRDKTIASLRNAISGGTTVVTVTPPSDTDPQRISYDWTDPLKRFHLSDPNIFESDNEHFTYQQHVMIKGYVLYGKDGKLQIRKVDIHEVVPDGNDASGRPKYKTVDGGKMELVDSTFEYADLGTREKRLWDILHPRLIASLDGGIKLGTLESDVRPGVGVEVINLGKYIDYANVGLNAKITPNFDNVAAGSLLKTRMGVGVNYTMVPPLLDTNFGLGMSISTPSNNLLNEWYVTVDALFYLTN